EGTHEKSPKCLGGNLGDFGEFCKGLGLIILGNFKMSPLQNSFSFQQPKSKHRFSAIFVPSTH
ncbi:hypothetical protein ACTHSP_11740, partial [Neisseria sp. P0001.S005]|uniref:hypothetical protein n=1 Tax=Neisseria sp. P0001.S005 TaxID=3436649 RepID=UPI003F819E1B